MPFSVSAQNAAAHQAASQAQDPLVRNILMQGFVLDDKSQFAKLFKPYRNKRLSEADISAILAQLQEIYEQAGYQGLVSIEYTIKNGRLTFTVALVR